MEHDAARSRSILACLGDSSRFRLVLSLLERERCVTELAGEVGLSQSCTTRHLQYLEREGLVRGDRQGKRVVFRLRSDRARVRELLAWVTASSPGSVSGSLTGADIHTEGRPRRGMAGTRREGHDSGGATARGGADRAESEAGSGRRPGDAFDAGRAGAAPTPPGPDRDEVLPETAGPRGGADMEDWLL